MLAHVLERALAIRNVAAVVLATSHAERDKPLTWIADDLGVAAFCGDETDVLGRFHAVARGWKADAVMRITGDCPLLAPEVCDRVLADYAEILDPHVDYVSNDTTASGYPDGTDCEVMSFGALAAADRDVRAHADREHVTTWLRRNVPQRVVMADDGAAYGSTKAYGASPIKLSVDSADDIARVRKIYGYLSPGDFSLRATLDAVRRADL